MYFSLAARGTRVEYRKVQFHHIIKQLIMMFAVAASDLMLLNRSFRQFAEEIIFKLG